MVGQRIGPYEILEKLGSGGMGEVWLAEDTRLERKVALKFLPHFAAQDENEKARFIQEAKAAARLSHANIAQIHEIDEEEGRLYIVMEFVAGGSLRDQLDEAKGRPLPLEKVMEWVRQTADGLAEAHRHGIVHRDIKPDNLMLTDTGQVKITDFGLARLETATRLTASGTTLGTVNYMSPELVTGKDVDHRTDLFSLGATFYELLTGQQVFSGIDATAIFYAILNAPVEPVARYRKDISEKLEWIIEKLLDKDPARRYQSAAEVVTDIHRVLGHPLRTSLPLTPGQLILQTTKKITRPFVLGAGILIGILCGAVLMTRGSTPNLQFQRVYTDFEGTPAEERMGVWSHSGERIVFQRKDPDDNWWLIARRFGEDQSQSLTEFNFGIPADCLFWSKDDSRLYFTRNHVLFSMPSVGGPIEQLYSPALVAAQSPVSEDIVVLDPGRGLLVSVHPDSSFRLLRELPGQVLRAFVRPGYMRFSPDGQWMGLSYFHHEERLELVNTLPLPSSLGEDAPRGTAGFWVFPWDEHSRGEPYEPFDLSEVSRSLPPSFDWIDSRHVLLSHISDRMDGGFWIGDIRSGTLERITMNSFWESSPSIRIRRDSLQILHERTMTDFDIVRVPLDGSAPVPYLQTSSREYSPSLSNGGDLAYLTNRSGQVEIHLRSAEGTDRSVVTPERIPEQYRPVLIMPPAIISPDGQYIVFAGAKEGLVEKETAFIAQTAGGGIQPLLPDEFIARRIMTWDPTSQWVAGNVAQIGGVVRISVVQPQHPQTLTKLYDAEATHVQWSPDGSMIAFIAIRQNGADCIIMTPEGREIQKVECYWDWANEVLHWSSDSSTLYLYLNGVLPKPLYGIQVSRIIIAVDVRTGQVRKHADLVPGIDLATGYDYTIFGSPVTDGLSFLTTARVAFSDLVILEGIPWPLHK